MTRIESKKNSVGRENLHIEDDGHHVNLIALNGWLLLTAGCMSAPLTSEDCRKVAQYLNNAADRMDESS